jgi:transcriptional regulator with XRE-family HTH domain
METLAEYVDRVMKEKNLKSLDVEARSIELGHRITDSYITSIAQGVNKNPSVRKLNALADALDVDRIELFKIASGMEEPEDSWTLETILKVYQKIPTLKPAEIKQAKKLLKIG